MKAVLEHLDPQMRALTLNWVDKGGSFGMQREKITTTIILNLRLWMLLIMVSVNVPDVF